MSSPDEDEEPEEPQGRIRVTGPGPLVVAGVLGLVLGWAVRPLCLRFGYAEPDVSLLTIGVLFFVAAIIGGSAYLTRRTVLRDRFALAHHQAVNRLVLGKACALAGALLIGRLPRLRRGPARRRRPGLRHPAVALVRRGARVPVP